MGTTLVASGKLPEGDYQPVGQVNSSFDALLSRKSIRAKRVYRALEGGWYRFVVLSLTTGRHAMLRQLERYPEYFVIHLACQRRLFFSRAEFQEVCDYIETVPEDVMVFTGQVKWR